MPHEEQHEVLSAPEALDFASRLIASVGMREKLEVLLEPSSTVLRVCGPAPFGFLGTTVWHPLRVSAPFHRVQIALAVARHAVGDWDLSDSELIDRAHTFPLPLAIALG